MVLNPEITALYHRDQSSATEEEGFLNYDWYFQKREETLLADERIPAQKRHYIRCLLDHFRIHKARHYLMDKKWREALREMKKVKWDPKNKKRIIVTWGMLLVPPFVLGAMYRLKRKMDQM